ncbi:acyl-CoA thioesterase [Streptomyces sp. SID11385]|uniref:acyl-CoA thioesterase n=1 Tax=Streptomyces sp. SID11385 TaxID=2706031 RepID=UPI0013C967A4|nr:acyl-CoA thioesterase [Streptomyces sp. SID11385]NEA38253.1 acyl-CoA thioesterase [Streptomyces sp. SID11385]
MSEQQFSVSVRVRGYETDVQGHLNQSVYLQYAEHARWELFLAAGITQADLVKAGIGPVVLETTIRYLRELRAGDEVTVGCAFLWGGGKAFRVEQTITRADGVVAAEITGVAGVLDLVERRLVPDPRERMRELATDPAPLGF